MKTLTTLLRPEPENKLFPVNTNKCVEKRERYLDIPHACMF
jgi:hypothetical protein